MILSSLSVAEMVASVYRIVFEVTSYKFHNIYEGIMQKSEVKLILVV